MSTQGLNSGQTISPQDGLQAGAPLDAHAGRRGQKPDSSPEFRQR